MEMLSKIHIAVEGAIAVGKTTLLPKLHSVIASHNIDIDLVFGSDIAVDNVVELDINMDINC